MMVAAAVQAAAAQERDQRGIIDLDSAFADWVDPRFRALLGDRAHWLEPVPEEVW
jgi:hypothetical protein